MQFLDAWDERHRDDFNLDSVRVLNTFEPGMVVQERTKLPRLIFEDVLDTDLDEWENEGDEDWEIAVFEGPTPPFAEDSTRRVAFTENCDDSCILTMASPISLEPYRSVELFFYYYVSENVDDDEGLYVYGSEDDGATWDLITSYTEDNGADDGAWHGLLRRLTCRHFDDAEQFKLRFEAVSDRSDEDVMIAEVDMYGSLDFTKKKPRSVSNLHASDVGPRP